MSKVAIVVLSDNEGNEALGRIVNALTAAKEYKDAGDDIQVVFSGAGTKWVADLYDPKHKLHGLFRELHEQVSGACGYCADAFGVSDSVKVAGVGRLEEYGTNMSYRKLTQEGYQILTF